MCWWNLYMCSCPYKRLTPWCSSQVCDSLTSLQHGLEVEEVVGGAASGPAEDSPRDSSSWRRSFRQIMVKLAARSWQGHGEVMARSWWDHEHGHGEALNKTLGGQTRYDQTYTHPYCAEIILAFVNIYNVRYPCEMQVKDHSQKLVVHPLKY